MAERSDVLPGAEPLSHAGGPAGVLVLHGFTGSPGTMRSVAEALVGAGFTVELPRLPGHGTTIDDMLATGFADWAAAADAAFEDLAARCERVAVVGLSLGGTLTCWLAARRPEVAGIAVINPLVQPPEPEMLDMVRAMIDAGETVAPGVGSDIAKEGVVEIAYDGSPLGPALSMFEAVGELQEGLGRITCPVLVMTSVVDHVVPPENSDHLATAVAGPVERVALERSYHVATMDHDAELVAERTIAFVRSVTGA